MKILDRLLQAWRHRAVSLWVPKGGKILDIGCHQGEFLNNLKDFIDVSVGFDPLFANKSKSKHVFHKEHFKKCENYRTYFDGVFLLAVFEHIIDKDSLIDDIKFVLKKNGFVVLTIPHKNVDNIIYILKKIKMIDGMSLEEHHGYNHKETKEKFEMRGFRLIHFTRFQLGFNYLYVFMKE